ncbi:hypothetical protein ACHQM5_002605 [Ranunculus cassubicifolius]
MTGESKLFTSVTSPIHQSVRLVDGSYAPILRMGEVSLSPSITLQPVFHVPNLAPNLLFVSRLTKSLNCAVTFLSDCCLIQDRSTRGYERNGLYYFEDPPPPVSVLQASVLPVSHSYNFSLESLNLWHARLGHVNFQYLCLLFPALVKACKSHKFHCHVCALSKHTRSSYISRMHRTPCAFDLIHSDVWGPSPVTSLSGHRYYVTFIDDHTRCTWVYLLKKKSEVLPSFTQFLRMVKTQYNVVRGIRSDNAKEYVSDAFVSQLNKQGILQQLSNTYTPEQNGVAERKNRSLMVVVRCLLRGMNVPKNYWHMAVLTASYLLNRTPSRILHGKPPLRLLHPDKILFPVVPRIFGCVCYVQNRSPTCTKLDDKAIKCIFLGYAAFSKGYRCFDPLTHKFYHTMDVSFLEDTPFFGKSFFTRKINPLGVSFT